MALNGFDGEQIKEAARTVGVGAGFSAYFHGVEYPVDEFKDELAGAVEFIKSQAK